MSFESLKITSRIVLKETRTSSANGIYMHMTSYILFQITFIRFVFDLTPDFPLLLFLIYLFDYVIVNSSPDTSPNHFNTLSLYILSLVFPSMSNTLKLHLIHSNSIQSNHDTHFHGNVLLYLMIFSFLFNAQNPRISIDFKCLGEKRTYWIRFLFSMFSC